MKILFVCLGNICRSPAAEGVAANILGREEYIIDSAGTGPWHVGESPDKRMQRAMSKKGYDISNLRGRQVNENDFFEFDIIFAMDETNYMDMQALRPKNSTAALKMITDYASTPIDSVPDPYYGGHDGFVTVIDILEDCIKAIKIDLEKNA